MEVALSFDDSRKWGQRSFLDYLELNDISFHYDGMELTFPSSEEKHKAAKIWEALTGMQQIGVVA